ncbi:hypothetical protein [Streptomyces sp. NRRL S-920]|uniref:hypothetical protein n=1 Tax=Streptomyces sp. NRRL S-920 TaxID=1463921 RepID=UPI0004C96D75|nr:hypothetical protein [Streptomyces sp. NRRL S-920]
MPFMALTIAELRLRASQLRLKAAALDYKIPGEGVTAQSRRFRQAGRYVQQAADFDALAQMAEVDE